MKAPTRIAGLLLLSCSLSFAAEHSANTAPHWEYAGQRGPAHWATLDPAFAACAGHQQSPIDLTHFTDVALPPITFAYKAGGHTIINNGHTVQVDYDPGSSVSIDNMVFALKQFHFHVPSENHIAGRAFPMEAHFVHADGNGHLAVVAVMFVQGASNPALDALWAHLPTKADERHDLSPEAAAVSLLPANRDYYRYEGSLTTPPCSEGVRWFVLKQPVTASAAQISRMAAALGHANNRPIQPIGSRIVEE